MIATSLEKALPVILPRSKRSVFTCYDALDGVLLLHRLRNALQQSREQRIGSLFIPAQVVNQIFCRTLLSPGLERRNSPGADLDTGIMGFVALVAYLEVVMQNILHHHTSQPCISLYCGWTCVVIELAVDG